MPKKKYSSLPKPVKLELPDTKAPDDQGLGLHTPKRTPPKKRKKPPHTMPQNTSPLRKGQRKKPQRPGVRVPRVNVRHVAVVAWLGAGVLGIALLIWFVSNLFVYNAFAVFLDGELVGHIPYSEELTSEEFHEYAVLHLEATHGGVRVRVDQIVTIEAARVATAERGLRSDVLGILSRRFNYSIAATAVHVHGQRMALMRTQSDLDHLKELLQQQWFTEHTVRAEFVTGWEEITYYVNPDETEFDNAMAAFRRLDTTRMEMYPYIVQDGDTLSSIAVRHGTDVNRIMLYNNLTGPNISIGQTLMIYTLRPLLSVRTFDIITQDQPIDMPVETIDRPDWPGHQSNIIQYGQAGLQVAREEIVRENGVERSRRNIDAEIITEPITHIIEVGSGTGALEVR